MDETKPPTLQVTVDRHTTVLTSESLCIMLQLPVAKDNDHNGFEVFPTSQELVEFFITLGFNTEAKMM